MTIKGLTLRLLLALVIYDFSVTDARDCSFPWFGVTSEINSTTWTIVLSKSTMNHNKTCPPNLGYGDSNKEYCCYNLSGLAECCDAKYFIVMGFAYFSSIFIIILACCSMCCLCLSCCSIFKRTQNGTPADVIHLIPNEHLPHKTNW